MTAQHSAAPFGPTATVREGRSADVETVVAMVRELAEYERAADQARITPEQLHRALFEGAAPDGHAAAYLLVAEVPGEDTAPTTVGFALWFLNFSTWEGVHGIYLEDLYVRPAHRGSGAGRALLTALARTATERGYARVDWSVLTWNEPAIGFYRRIGAIPLEEWRTYRLTGSALASLAR
ncbi:Ribosomal protein S18 acetylase RimI [Microlunatus sagamiharensis]|uniref:Ribosomal protein S18 acetylase RimI n=1 Tax=Microlunatus sagamiharensis TaxID=546874 RepID=A0A1H2MXG2_9ACTN|nr:GNAT family N-acetyltransferase [Microlunatus sagamiharensis]SDU97939.1 Ribosomal protein S18 acetylase RimI [Microlunatus sagamiharensis]